MSETARTMLILALILPACILGPVAIAEAILLPGAATATPGAKVRRNTP